jgi:hypothetical protein
MKQDSLSSSLELIIALLLIVLLHLALAWFGADEREGSRVPQFPNEASNSPHWEGALR